MNINYNKVFAQINDCCEKYNQDRNKLRVFAVSKGQDAEKIRQVYDLGQRYFAENYCDELILKAEKLNIPNIYWAYIGTLQSNKVQRIVKLCSEIQTVASLKHVRYVAKYARFYKKVPYPIFIAVNSMAEEKKSGITWLEAEKLSQQISEEFPELSLQGAFVIPPKDISESNGDEILTFLDNCVKKPMI